MHSEDLLDVASADPAEYVRTHGGASAFVEGEPAAGASLIAQAEQP